MKGEKRKDMRQIIIARKDLGMSAGKLAAQCAHASIAFLSKAVREGQIRVDEDSQKYIMDIEIRADVVDEWINGIFTKTVCEAKSKAQLIKAVKIAEDLGLKENEDFFLIKDCCLTELEPEEVDEHGVGRTLTCIGFRPLPDDVAHQISKKYQLYK